MSALPGGCRAPILSIGLAFLSVTLGCGGQGDPAPGEVLFLPGATHERAFESSLQRTDLRIFNPAYERSRVRLRFVPSGDGEPVSVKLALGPGELLALDDVVGTRFRRQGPGHIEIDGGAGLAIGQRTYMDTPAGTRGGYVAPLRAGAGPVYLAGLGGRSSRTLVGLVPARPGAGSFSSSRPGRP